MNDYIKSLIEKKNKTNEMIKNCEYVEWLSEFTKKYNNFSMDSWLYSPSEISKEDNEKVNFLDNFVDGLLNIAKKHYVDILYEDNFCGENFWFVYKDVYYNIGFICGQGTSFFVERKEKKPEDIIYLDYINAINDVYDDRVLEINNRLNDLEKYIKDLSELKISKEIILSKINQILDK